MMTGTARLEIRATLLFFATIGVVTQAPRKNVSLLLMFIISISVAIIDQATKMYMLHALQDGPIYLIGDWFRFRLLFNPGAAFSLGENSTWLFTCLQLAFVLGVVFYARRIHEPLTRVSFALIAGGALGNLIDRLFREPAFFIGHVVDFISVGNFAVFNIADSAITCGVILFIIGMLFEEYQTKKRA